MSRTSRRAWEQHVRHSLRVDGCTCSPQVQAVAPVLGATRGSLVVHEAGCSYGDAFLLLNQLGIVPATFDHVQRCER